MHPHEDKRGGAYPQLDFELLLSDRDLERLTGRARSTWQKMRLTGDGPRYIKLGRHVRYPKSEFEAWLATRPILRSTSDDGAAA
jgi:predicted DNA-binding transcriptional regulator AlpA